MSVRLEYIRIGDEFYAFSDDIGSYPSVQYVKVEEIVNNMGTYGITHKGRFYQIKYLCKTEKDLWKLVDEFFEITKNVMVENLKRTKETVVRLSLEEAKRRVEKEEANSINE